MISSFCAGNDDKRKKNHQSFIIGRHVWTRSNGFFSACWRCCELLMSSVVADVAPPSDRFSKCSLNLVVFDLLYWIASSKWRFHWYILKWSLSALKLNSRSISGIWKFYTGYAFFLGYRGSSSYSRKKFSTSRPKAEKWKCFRESLFEPR